MPVAIKQIQSESLVKFTSPDQASIEFGIVLAEILKELQKDETTNLTILKAVSSTLTIQNNSNIHVFTDKQLEEIQACNSIPTLLTNKLRHCYRWDNFSMLKILMLSINSDKCVNLLETFKVKIDSKMKLQKIYEHCKQKEWSFSEKYDKLVAIVNNKLFSKITKEEYDDLKCFVSEHCGVEAYVVCPLNKASSSSLILEWYISINAVAHMIKIASSNNISFNEKSFVYLRISSTVILDYRDIVSGLMTV